jgi:hypothetical protein
MKLKLWIFLVSLVVLQVNIMKNILDTNDHKQ